MAKPGAVYIRMSEKVTLGYNLLTKLMVMARLNARKIVNKQQ